MHQIENGYTRIANTILEELSKKAIPSNMFRVLLWVIRNSYGYNRKETGKASIRIIARDTNMVTSSTGWALRILLDTGLLQKSKGDTLKMDKNKITAFVQPIGQLNVSNPLDSSVQPIGQIKQPIGHLLNIRSKDNLKDNSKERAVDGFDVFWEHYPKKVGKGSARTIWAKRKPILDTCLKALEWQKKSDQWAKDGGQFIPHPSTWLNQERWDDGPPRPKYIHPDWLKPEPILPDKTPAQIQEAKDRYNVIIAKGIKQ